MNSQRMTDDTLHVSEESLKDVAIGSEVKEGEVALREDAADPTDEGDSKFSFKEIKTANGPDRAMTEERVDDVTACLVPTEVKTAGQSHKTATRGRTAKGGGKDARKKSYHCHDCDYQSVNQRNMFRHLRNHTGVKPFSCTVCDNRFSLKHHLERHMRSHTGEKPFSCTVCDHRFTQKHHLENHLKTHTGGKPFSCIVCDNRFGLKHHLERHMRRFHLRENQLTRNTHS